MMAHSGNERLKQQNYKLEDNLNCMESLGWSVLHGKTFSQYPSQKNPCSILSIADLYYRKC
jgi:hypothetical protein